MTSPANSRMPLIPINTKTLKKKEIISFIYKEEEPVRQQPDVLAGENKLKKKPFRPPVPKFEETSVFPQIQIESENKCDEVTKNELFSKFLEEINGGTQSGDQAGKRGPGEIQIEEEIPPAKKQEEIKKPKPIQPPPDINFDLISNLYKKQVAGAGAKDATSPSSASSQMLPIKVSVQNAIAAAQNQPSQANVLVKPQPSAFVANNNTSQSTVSAAKNVPPAVTQKSMLKLKKEEYDPARPNDYETIIADRLRKKKEEESLMKEREIEMEIEKLNSKEKSSKSTADHNARRERLKNMEIEKSEEPVQENKYSEGAHEEKILKMMEKTGWKFGGGLGKNEQGMTTPLIPVKTNSTTAIIMNSNIEMQSVLPQDIVLRKTLESQNLKPTKVLLLLNMVSRSEVDDHLRDEVTEECSKHGKVLDCVILMLNNMADDAAVRIFVDFDKKESAIKAFCSLNGRFFGGRTVQARFYEESNFIERKYDL